MDNSLSVVCGSCLALTSTYIILFSSFVCLFGCLLFTRKLALVIVAGCFASASDIAGYMKRLAVDFEEVSTLQHESKYGKVHGIIASLSPMKGNSSGSVSFV